MSLHLLGIRHHGPGSARSVLRALDELRPDVVLVEVPADVDAALRWVGEPGLVPPVALLTYVPAEPGRAAFAPFATFSPKFLKNGSVFDLVSQVRPGNLWPMIKVAIDNPSLITYLVGELLKSHKAKAESLRTFMPGAEDDD